jgi:IS5 family transposase
MKIRQVGAELFHADRQTDGRTEMTKLRVAFRNFANAPKNACNGFSRNNKGSYGLQYTAGCYSENLLKLQSSTDKSQGARPVASHYVKNNVTALRFPRMTNAVVVRDGYDTLINLKPL